VDVPDHALDALPRWPVPQLRLAHDLAQSLQGLFGFALSAQDHEIIGVGHDARAEASLQPEHLPSQHEPAHVQICQQW
jgi:hypothetical protein